ncbi:tyrosine-type recombinase/integrase [Pseudactinotalea sp. HY160]|uniref:tyrosine-type recombinase/integrase n=1 Tax=Pseudactinotalea sp. HY160 TaxID=2654490 RepID=UPI00128D26C5|nr:site-specific integrase [Pseudactinotalea sp. HY160]MPV50281.1 tyrosine-type recombinase/integrase [Pseudactinotalea sp. HY160]
MARAKLAVGETGGVSVTREHRAKGSTGSTGWKALPRGARAPKSADVRWVASCTYRESASATRRLRRYGPTQATARQALLDAVAELREPSRSNLAGLTRRHALSEIATEWGRRTEARTDLSETTKRVYRDALRSYLLPNALASRPLEEVNRVAAVRDYLQAVAGAHGYGAARQARNVLSGVLQLAAEADVLPNNAARGVEIPRTKGAAVAVRSTKRRERLEGLEVPAKAWARDTTRALTKDERDAFRLAVATDELAIKRDVADLVQLLAGTGARIGEALALRWEHLDVTAGTLHVKGTKTDGSDRVLHLPAWLLEVLSARRAKSGVGYIFPSPKHGSEVRRDASAVQAAMRILFDRHGLSWATVHTLRRSVATIMHTQGVPLVEVANQLGHADASMTMRVYLGRNAGAPSAAHAL